MHGDTRPAVEKLYHLCPKVSSLRVSVASQGVCFVRISCVPSRQPHAYELHRKIWICKVSKNLKVLNTVLLYVTWSVVGRALPLPSIFIFYVSVCEAWVTSERCVFTTYYFMKFLLYKILAPKVYLCVLFRSLGLKFSGKI